MKKKTVLTIEILLLITTFLTGCHLKHEWQEATCTNPKTCSACGETEGEALGHSGVLTVFGKGELTEETWEKALEKFDSIN